jgi:SOS-response transcriptional repressor LexA
MPIYRWGSLGDPRDRESSPHPDREEYPPAGREYLIGPNGFGVDVRGSSMVGRDVRDGDVCWVNPDRSYRVGDLVLALLTDDDGESGMVIKTYARNEGGEGLIAETAEGRQSVDGREFKIIGPVVGIQRWFPPP